MTSAGRMHRIDGLKALFTSAAEIYAVAEPEFPNTIIKGRVVLYG